MIIAKSLIFNWHKVIANAMSEDLVVTLDILKCSIWSFFMLIQSQFMSLNVEVPCFYYHDGPLKPIQDCFALFQTYWHTGVRDNIHPFCHSYNTFTDLQCLQNIQRL